MMSFIASTFRHIDCLPVLWGGGEYPPGTVTQRSVISDSYFERCCARQQRDSLLKSSLAFLAEAQCISQTTNLGAASRTETAFNQVMEIALVGWLEGECGRQVQEGNAAACTLIKHADTRCMLKKCVFKDLFGVYQKKDWQGLLV